MARIMGTVVVQNPRAVLCWPMLLALLSGCSGKADGVTSVCLSGWSTPEDAPFYSEPLNIEAPRLLWERRVEWDPLNRGGGMADSRDRVVLTVGSLIYFIDKNTGGEEEISRRLEPYHSTHDAWSAPVTDKDGNVYLAECSGIYSLTPAGDVRWKRTSTGCGCDGEGCRVHPQSAPVLSPEGMLFAMADHSKVHAIDARTGEEHWSVAIPTDDPMPPEIVGAGGDAIIVRENRNADFFAISTLDGKRIGSMNRICLGLGMGTLGWTIAVQCQSGQKEFNTCPLPSVAATTPNPDYFAIGTLIAPGERLVVVDAWRDPKTGWEPGNLTLYRRDGSVAVGPAPARGWPKLVGADGTIFTVGDAIPVADGWAVHLVALSRELEVLWELEIPSVGAVQGTVLDDSGILYLAQGDGPISVAAIQTRSPGLARSSWPASYRDNHRNQWLGFPVRDGQVPDAGAADTAH